MQIFSRIPTQPAVESITERHGPAMRDKADRCTILKKGCWCRCGTQGQSPESWVQLKDFVMDANLITDAEDDCTKTGNHCH